MVHEKAEAFKKFAKALNDQFQSYLTETSNTNEGTIENKTENQLDN